MGVISGVSVKFVKASVDWTGLRVHVPFADKVASVSEWIEQFRNGRALTIETTKITGAAPFVWLIGGGGLVGTSIWASVRKSLADHGGELHCGDRLFGLFSF
jgi:hypothetical protein